MKSSLYTFTGDKGMTSLVGGTRVSKADVRIEAYGTIDELNSHIAVLAVELSDDMDDVKKLIRRIQNRLFNVGAYLATEESETVWGLSEADVKAIEEMIDTLDAQVPKFRNFVLPGGSKASALADVCRTTARRAERRIIALAQNATVSELVLRFVNRLSDFFFILARFNNIHNGIDEIFWSKD